MASTAPRYNVLRAQVFREIAEELLYLYSLLQLKRRLGIFCIVALRRI
jgi:hypothetical protein